MRIGREHGLGVIANAGSDDVQGTLDVKASVVCVRLKMCKFPVGMPAAFRWVLNTRVSRWGRIGMPSSSANAGFLGDIRKGKNLLATATGTRVKANAIFAPSKFVNWIEATALSTGGPVFPPELDGDEHAVDGDPQSHGGVLQLPSPEARQPPSQTRLAFASSG